MGWKFDCPKDAFNGGGGLVNWMVEAAAAAGVAASLIGSFTVIHRSIKNLLESFLSKQMEEISKHIDKIEMTSAKSFIVMCLSRLSRDEKMSPMEKQRFWEAVAEYHRQGGNGYIDAEISLYKELNKL